MPHLVVGLSAQSRVVFEPLLLTGRLVSLTPEMPSYPPKEGKSFFHVFSYLVRVRKTREQANMRRILEILMKEEKLTLELT